MTPLQITMLLHYHAIARPYAWNDPEHARSRAVDEQRRSLVSYGMLTSTKDEIGYELTERGKFFVNYISSLSLPEPVSGWRMLTNVS